MKTDLFTTMPESIKGDRLRFINTFYPYLVGSYDEVAKNFSKYLDTGCKTCIIDTPVSEIELHSTIQIFNRAQLHLEKEVQL